jgi:transposase
MRRARAAIGTSSPVFASSRLIHRGGEKLVGMRPAWPDACKKIGLSKLLPYRTIQERLDTTAPTISRWRNRFEKRRVAGLLEIRHPGQEPSVITPSLQAKVLEASRCKPSDGSAHWSCRKMAQHLKISKDTVQRIWHEAGLKPHRLERYMASDDPDFARKAADIIGLYLNPPQHAAVFCIDEKCAIQALDRLDPVLPLSPGRIERHGFEYYRHGTLPLCSTG